MEFHPDKCQVLTITNKISPIHSNYFIHSTKLSSTASAKYLGITIDKNLKFTKHINNVCAKTSSTLSFLQRNLSHCPKHVKNVCYKTLIRPVLEYGCCVWDPHHQNYIEKLEKIQKRAARFATGNYAFTSGNSKKNLLDLDWKALVERRARSKLITLFKGRAGLIDIPIDDLIVPNRTTRRKAASNFHIPHSSVDSHLHSFFPSTIRLWNSLPEPVKACDSLTGFQQALDALETRIRA